MVQDGVVLEVADVELSGKEGLVVGANEVGLAMWILVGGSMDSRVGVFGSMGHRLGVGDGRHNCARVGADSIGVEIEVL